MRLWPIKAINGGDREHFDVSEMCISQIAVDLFPFTYLLLFSLLPTRLVPDLTIRVTCEMSYKKLLTLRENPCSPPVLVAFMSLIRLVFFAVFVLLIFVLLLVPNVALVSGFCILDCSMDFL